MFNIPINVCRILCEMFLVKAQLRCCSEIASKEFKPNFQKPLMFPVDSASSSSRNRKNIVSFGKQWKTAHMLRDVVKRLTN